MKKLSELYDIDSDILVSGISINSKEVKNGDIFVCVSGVNFDRHLFVDEAINNGCCCIVASRDIGKRCVPVIYVDNTDTELTKLAKKLYDYKDGNLGLFGVTGTNGKTSVTSIISIKKLEILHLMLIDFICILINLLSQDVNTLVWKLVVRLSLEKDLLVLPLMLV